MTASSSGRARSIPKISAPSAPATRLRSNAPYDISPPPAPTVRTGLYAGSAFNSPPIFSNCQIIILLVDENEDAKNGQIKAKGRFLAIPGMRLPHLKPLTADDHETEEPHKKAEGGANEYETLAAVEASGSGPQLAHQHKRCDRQGQRGQSLTKDDQPISRVPQSKRRNSAILQSIPRKCRVHAEHMTDEFKI